MLNHLKSLPGYLQAYQAFNKARRLVREPGLVREALDLQLDLTRTRLQASHYAADARSGATCDRRAVFLSFTSAPVWAKFHSLLATGLRSRGYAPTMLGFKGNRWGFRYFRAFGLDSCVRWDDLVERFAPSEASLKDELRHLNGRGASVQEIKNLMYHGVAVGRHALSQTVRDLVKGRVDLQAPDVQELFERYLYLSAQGVRVAEAWLDEVRPSIMIVRDPGYVPNGALYEAACLRGVDTIRCEMGQKLGTWIFKRHSPTERWMRHISISPSTWQKLRHQPLAAEQEEALRQEYRERYMPDSKSDMRRLQAGKCDKTPEQVRAELGLDPNKKTAVVFSHVAFDAAFFYGEDLFEDLEEWFVETARAACRNPHLNWVLKLHPGNLVKLQRVTGEREETEMAALRNLMPLPGHVKLLRAHTDINTRSLLNVMDFGLTVRGTVGFELPSLGIPCLTAGTGAYTGYGFTIDSATQEEYLQKLERLHELPPLTPEQIDLAKRHAYHLVLRRQTSFQDVAPMTAEKLENARKKKAIFWNVRLGASSPEELVKAQSMRAFLDWATSGREPDLLV